MLKRTFDLLVSGLGILILGPFLLIIALGVKLDSQGPVFYRAVRVGKGGSLFRLYKFRTMVVNADKAGPGITTLGDSRITRIGQFLRRTKFDEIPQLINVFKGEMSLVGPRPEDPRYVALYTEEQRQVLNVKPGITSPASVAFRHEEQMLSGADWESTYIKEVMPAKLAIDLKYCQQPTLLADIQVIWSTFLALFRPHKSATDAAMSS